MHGSFVVELPRYCASINTCLARNVMLICVGVDRTSQATARCWLRVDAWQDTSVHQERPTRAQITSCCAQPDRCAPSAARLRWHAAQAPTRTSTETTRARCVHQAACVRATPRYRSHAVPDRIVLRVLVSAASSYVRTARTAPPSTSQQSLSAPHARLVTTADLRA